MARKPSSQLKIARAVTTPPKVARAVTTPPKAFKRDNLPPRGTKPLTKKNLGGRPKQSPAGQINITMSLELKKLLERMAEAQGLTVSEYVRLKVFNSSETRREAFSPVEEILRGLEPPPANWGEYNQRIAHATYELSQKVNRWSAYLTARDRGFSVDEYRDKSMNQVPEYLEPFNKEQRYQFWDFMNKGMTKEQALLELQKQSNSKP